jgi:hypothetical protein
MALAQHQQPVPKTPRKRGVENPENKEEVRQNWAVPKSLIFGTLGVSGVRDLRAVMCARPIGASAALVSLLKAHAPMYRPSFGL